MTHTYQNGSSCSYETETTEIQYSADPSHTYQNGRSCSYETETSEIEYSADPSQNDAIGDPGSMFVPNNENMKDWIAYVSKAQKLIEICIQMYKTKEEVVQELFRESHIDPQITTEVWYRLEKQNAEFFHHYFIRLELKRQIIMFNHQLKRLCKAMNNVQVPPKVPSSSPLQVGVYYPMPVNSMPMEYPVLPQPPMEPTGQPSMHLSNTTPSISGIGDNPSTFDAEFTGLPENGTEATRSSEQMLFNYSISDLTADISNLEDLGALGNYLTSPFSYFDSDFILPQ